MTKKILLLTTFCLMCMSAFASFPVNKKNVEKAIANVETISTQAVTIDANIAKTVTMPQLTVDAENALSPAATGADDDLLILLVLWLLIWPLAAHRWYAGKPAGWNILFILTFGGFGIWALVDLINILTDNF
ncbi:MAG: hypothetical protein ACI9P5_001305 [Saprospiraceae bacterium]|jgi:hypothetical protein